MSYKLFGKSIDPKCEYCAHGKPTAGKSMVLCRRKGVIQPDFSCRNFKYDPLKRAPRRLPDLPSYDQSQFDLE